MAIRSTGREAIYGRDAERATIEALVDHARASRSGVLIVRGEAGIGKSALLADALERTAGVNVLRARGVESESELPYAGLHQLLRPALSHLDRLPAPQATALRSAFGMQPGRANERFLVSVAVLSLLSEMAEQRALLCLVDDVHWLDEASADALVFVARRLQAEPIVMLFAARDGEGHRFAAPDLPELQLRGLERDAAGTLLGEQAGVSVAPNVRDLLLARTGGNPLALLELASALSGEQLTGKQPLPVPLPPTVGVERLFLERVRRLPKETQRLMLVAAADDSGWLAPVLAAAQTLGVRAAALDAAEEAGLLHVRGTQIAFRHPLVRSAVYHGATLGERQTAHRALAGVLAGEAAADRRAWHLAAAAVGPDEAVAGELEEAAERARRRGGFASASTAFERAADLTADEPTGARRLVSAAESARLAGQPERASVLLDRARPLAADPLLRADIDRLRGLIELGGGMARRAYEILARAADEVAPLDAQRALELLATAGEAVALDANRDAVSAGSRLVAGLRTGDTRRERFLVNLLAGFGRQFAGDVAGGVRALEDALRLAEGVDEPYVLLWAGYAAGRLGDDTAAHRFHAQVVARARERGAVGDIPLPMGRLALFETRLGRWAAAAASASEALSLARATGQEQLTGYPLAWLALIAALRGQEEACRSYAAEAMQVTAVRPMRLIDDAVRWALGIHELGAGRAGEAVAQLQDISHPLIVSAAELDRIEAAVRAGRTELARMWLGSLEAWAVALPAPWVLARLAHGHALLSEGAAAERAFAEALAHHTRSPRPFERARTGLAFGEFLRRSRRRTEAREHLRAALDGFERLGAVAWAERARAELRASGETARRRDPSTMDQLTPQELQVARFVARGLSTREVAAQLFLSPRTVDFHLRNVFAKLGITSRAELAHLPLDESAPALT